MLWEEAEEFRRLSGEDPEETSIARIGGFLDGYEIGKACQKSAHWEIVTGSGILTFVSCSECGYGNYREDVKHWEYCPMCGRRLTDGKTA